MEEQHQSTCHSMQHDYSFDHYRNGCVQSNVEDQFFPVDIELDIAYRNRLSFNMVAVITVVMNMKVVTAAV